ncbi:MAG: GYD domain-containing protein [Bryobacteraceae bacterium]
MPKFMVHASYTAEGLRGLIKEGAAKRRNVVKKTMAAAGCKLEGMYFSLGGEDVVLLCDGPDNATVAAISATVSSTGAVRCRTTPLLTVDELDQGLSKAISYAPPGA